MIEFIVIATSIKFMPSMGFKFINEIATAEEDDFVLSIGFVDSRVGDRVYRIRFKDSSCTINTHLLVQPGDWIRFGGRYNNGNIKCEYIEIIQGFDINLIVKCLEKIREKLY